MVNRRTLNFRRQKLSNFPLTSKCLAIFLFYPCHMNGKGLLWELHCFPLFAPNIIPQSPSPTPQPRQAAESSPPPQWWTSHPADLPSAPWDPQLPTHHFTGAASPTGLSTAPDLLDRRHGPPHRFCFADALVHHNVGPSLTPSSAPSLALHTSPRPPQQIRLTESTVQLIEAKVSRLSMR